MLISLISGVNPPTLPPPTETSKTPEYEPASGPNPIRNRAAVDRSRHGHKGPWRRARRKLWAGRPGRGRIAGRHPSRAGTTLALHPFAANSARNWSLVRPRQNFRRYGADSTNRSAITTIPATKVGPTTRTRVSGWGGFNIPLLMPTPAVLPFDRRHAVGDLDNDPGLTLKLGLPRGGGEADDLASSYHAISAVVSHSITGHFNRRRMSRVPAPPGNSIPISGFSSAMRWLRSGPAFFPSPDQFA